MPRKITISPVNQLIKHLPAEQQRFIHHNSKTIQLCPGDVLCEYSQDPDFVYFPLSGLISIVISVDDEPPYSLAMIGCEGMLGATRVLGITKAPMKSIVQVTGYAARLTCAAFDSLLKDSPALQFAVKRFLFSLMMQLNRTAACSRFHDVNNRLARWLLLTHDRCAGDSFFLTQQFLSEIIGVQRSAISIAASKMQKNLLITYVRGHITILNRKGLEAAACSCYEAGAEDLLRFSHSTPRLTA